MYKRIVAVCYYNNQNLNKLMVRNGWAIAYRRYSKDYINDENYAKENQLGIWEETFLSLVNGEKKIENNLKKLTIGVGLDLF